MKEWLLERRLTLLIVGIAVPLLGALSFWRLVRRDWQFWLACYVVSFPAGVFITWVRQRGREYWDRLGTRKRMLLRSAVIAILWFLVVLEYHNSSDRFFLASFSTVVVVLLWSGYALFSWLMDTIAARIRGR